MTADFAWRVEPLAPSRRDAFLRFFDHERGRAFADNPAWAGCYCHFFHTAPALDADALEGAANRTAMCARIDVGEMEGYLAFDEDDRVDGWLNAQPRNKLPHAFARLRIEPTPLDVPAHRAAAVLCFVVDPAQRGRGVARALLRHAIDDLSARGFAFVDAFPKREADGPAAHFRGPLALFEQHGFEPIAQSGKTVAMRRRLR